ncbi:MAG: hypothetical protein LBT09_09360 [Planctomycetaceae bacterium]|jgi:hypothetical protein|nr:hypothetical protein [Planctomycetaceae bacterium]
MNDCVSVVPPIRSLSDGGRVFPFGVRVGGTDYGLGVFAYAFIPKGTPIARVSGRIVVDPNYGSEYCINAGEDKVLEPAPPFCYLNHACEPNCLLTQYVREGGEAEGEQLEEGNLEASDLEPDETDEDDEWDDNVLGDDDECFFGDGGADNVDVVEAEVGCEVDNGNFDINNSGKLSGSISVSKNSNDKDNKIAGVGVTSGDVCVEFDPEFEDDADSEIWVETLRDILPGEQLTIDYAWPAEKAIKCQCGCKKCRGWIVAADELKLIENEK